MVRTIVIDKIHYKLISKDKTAHVQGFNVGSFPKIPETVCFGENTFKVVSIDQVHGLDIFQEVIEIPDFINSLYPNVFSKYHIKKLILGKGLTELPLNCFTYCNIEEIIFSKDSRITKINSNCFMGCKGLKHIDIPDTVTSILQSAFYYCSDLESIKLPNLKCLGSRVFKGCKSLSQIFFKDIFPIEEFRESSFLINVFPVKNGKIDIEFFVSESNLQGIADSGIIGSKKLKIRGYCQTTGECFTDLIYEIKDESSCVVTYNLNDKGDNTYTGDIIIPGKTIIGSKVYNVVGISDFAFFGCSGISSIEIPKNMEFDNVSEIAIDDKDNCIIFKRS